MEDFIIYDTIDSTNNESNRLLASGRHLHGTAILTLHQTEGRGQYGNSWYAKPGNHLAMSIILQPEKMPLDDLPLLSLKTSLALVRTLRSLDPSLHPLIKWPNDIYISDKKLAGILIENSILATKVQHSVIGIGMNINEPDFPKDLPRAISLFMLTGKEFQIFTLAKKIREKVMMIQDESPGTWKSEYDQCVYGIGLHHNFEMNGKRISAEITGVDLDGKIKLHIGDGGNKSYYSHEIKWIL